MARKSNTNNRSKVKLVKVKNMPGVYTSNASYHSTGTLVFSEITRRVSEPLKKTIKKNDKFSEWSVVESSD